MAFRLIPTLLGVLLGLGCSLDDELENRRCEVGDDCWSNQECVVTSRVPDVGFCRPKGAGCAEGVQPGCECAVDSVGKPACTGFGLVPTEDKDGCFCLPPSDGETDTM